MRQVIITEKHDWHCEDYFQGVPSEEGINLRGWAYSLVTKLMDDSSILNNKRERQKRKVQRRLKKMVRQAFRKYASGGKKAKKVLQEYDHSIGMHCLLNMGWRVRKNQRGHPIFIESN